MSETRDYISPSCASVHSKTAGSKTHPKSSNPENVSPMLSNNLTDGQAGSTGNPTVQQLGHFTGQEIQLAGSFQEVSGDPLSGEVKQTKYTGFVSMNLFGLEGIIAALQEKLKFNFPPLSSNQSSL